MRRNLAGKRFAPFVLILSLLLVSFVLGCQQEAKPSPEVEALPRAERLPETQVAPTAELTAEPSPTPSFINVLSATNQTDFPKSLTFSLEVESSSEITGIELRYRIRKVATAVVTTTIKPEFTPGRRAKTAWTWDTRKASLPPGAEIEYSWVIKNAEGDRTQTESAELTFDDSRYKWDDLTVGKVRLLWYQGDQSFSQELMDAAQEALGKLAEDTAVQLEKQVKLFVYASSEELREALVYSQEWTGGVAFPDYGLVAIGIAPGNLAWGKRAIAHELVHLAIHQVTFNPYSDLPTWLDEGLATYAEGELRGDLEVGLLEAISTSTLPSVRSLSSSFPTRAEEAVLAYAASHSLVKFLIDNYGSDKMLNLLQVFKQGSTYDDALLTVYGFDTDGLNDFWRRSLGLENRPTAWFQTGWADLALTFTGGYFPEVAGLIAGGKMAHSPG